MAILTSQALIFMVMVFIAVVFLAASVIMPTVGTEAQASKRMKKRINRVLESIDPDSARLLRTRRLDNASPLERLVQKLPGMSDLRAALDQSGIDKPSYYILVYALLLAALVFVVMGTLFKQPVYVALFCAAGAASLPFVYIFRKRAKRMAKFEEQLPEALDMMARALEAGHPFNETLQMVSEEMSNPIAEEFAQVFTDINYGLPLKTSFLALLSRVPSMSLNTLVTAVLIQQESGGRIAEILKKIAEVIRSRFKLQRKVKTLSAEGRLSAWILTLLPFVLAVVISITTPSYLPRMLNDPVGIKLIYVAFGFVLLGILWMRKIIRFKF